MKNVLLIAATILVFSCTRKDDEITPSSNNNNQTTKSTIETIVKNGIWEITTYNEDGNNKTYLYSDYLFDFGEDGTILASNANNKYDGIWSLNDSKSNDDSQNDIHFNLLFTDANILIELNDDWEIQSHSDTKIMLRDISGGNGGIDELVFEKI